MDFYVHYMEPYCGKIATIVKNLEGFIKLDIDNEEWWWREEMLELIEDTNENDCTKDTLGSKMRNHLSPFYNALCAISHCKQNVKESDITKDMLLEYLFNSYEDMFNSYKELLNISYNSILDETETIDKSISVCMSVDDNYVVYTLEEFKDKFPYKVGDEVIAYAEGCLAHFTIQDIRWNNKLNKIEYKICSSWYNTSLMQPYKEETITIDDFKANTKEWLIDKLESMSKDNALQTICNLYNELHKPKYPKTYGECCKVLDYYLEGPTIIGHKTPLLRDFQKLLICRDAYWKIAGNWEPNWNEETDKFTISNKCNKIYLNNTAWYSEVLAFPTAEMQNAFYENFKDLIEKCKELL